MTTSTDAGTGGTGATQQDAPPAQTDPPPQTAPAAQPAATPAATPANVNLGNLGEQISSALSSQTETIINGIREAIAPQTPATPPQSDQTDSGAPSSAGRGAKRGRVAAWWFGE